MLERKGVVIISLYIQITLASMSGPYADATLSRHEGSREFRLVELHPSKRSDPIRCTLCTYAFDSNPPPYTALSYTWGPKVKPKNIELNGVSFPVGYSLWSFLEEMRLQERFCVYWIDAICIDQESVLERNHQVQMMRHIYSNAQSVSIWLGDADRQSTSDIAMDFLSQRSQLVEVTPHPWHNSIQYTKAYHDHMAAQTTLGQLSGESPYYPEAYYDCMESKIISGLKSSEIAGYPEAHYDHAAAQIIVGQKPGEFPWSRKQAEAVLKLYNRPYWSRIWIVQEMFVAKVLVVFCGSRQCDWRALENLNNDLQHLRATDFPDIITDFKTSSASKLIRARLSYHAGKDYATQIEHLVSFCDLKATNILDKVYGVWGLVRDGAGFDIDYNIKPQELLIKLLHYTWACTPQRETSTIRECAMIMSDALGVRWAWWELDNQLAAARWSVRITK
jgi:hypothetical protein